ncbi:hypothetical protein DEEACLCL_00198 [Salmonella phage CRW-SP2]|nr:hypothetical protein DEEACLCL_00198 [Salmonella phage CRW-SP2]
MSVKTTGVEFKTYYHDDTYWVKDAWHDHHAIKVNGEYIEDIDDDNIPDNAEVVIESGVVYIPVNDESGYQEKDISLVTHFKNWRKQNKYSVIVLLVEKELLNDVVTTVKNIPGVSEVKGG